MKAWFLRALLQLRSPHRRVGECRGRGKLRALPGGQAGPEQRHPRHRPSLRGAVRFPVWRENPAKSNKAKGVRWGEERAGLVRVFASTGTRVPLPRPEPHAPAQASPATGFREESRAGWLCAPINLPGGRRAGGGRRASGLGAVCNFAASVAAVPGERAPALAPIGRRRVSWCDLLLSLLAFGHPETNQFDDY